MLSLLSVFTCWNPTSSISILFYLTSWNYSMDYPKLYGPMKSNTPKKKVRNFNFEISNWPDSILIAISFTGIPIAERFTFCLNTLLCDIIKKHESSRETIVSAQVKCFNCLANNIHSIQNDKDSNSVVRSTCNQFKFDCFVSFVTKYRFQMHCVDQFFHVCLAWLELWDDTLSTIHHFFVVYFHVLKLQL